MARTKKVVLTPEEQLEKLIADIETTEADLKEMKKQKKELEMQIKLDRLSELDEIITASGRSIEEVKELLGGNE